MKLSLIFFLLIISCKATIVEQCLQDIQIKSQIEINAQNLIKRLLPNHFQQFRTNVVLESKQNFYKVYSDEKKIVLEGNDITNLAVAFNQYLQRVLHKSISWQFFKILISKDIIRTGNNLNNLPNTFPLDFEPFSGKRNFNYSYYQNVCTSSYSFVWWDWKRWEKEIDWMAMKGINLALAFTGQEKVFQKTFEKFGVSNEEMRKYFGGPAFLAWYLLHNYLMQNIYRNRMGNVKSWPESLPQSFIDGQYELNKRIVQRMRELGIKTILPAFSGHVPIQFKQLYPNALISQTPQWGNFQSNFSSNYFLEPNDPLYAKVGNQFIQDLIESFGTDHFYNGDQFNEMLPQNNSQEYLSNCGKSMIESMTKSDPKAVWVVQAWTFVDQRFFWQNPQIQAYFSQISKQQLLILDLFSENFPGWNLTENYFNHYFIWNELHNFGGNYGLYGKLQNVIAGPFEAQNSSNSTILGIGITMEGINQNSIVYDLMLDVAYLQDETLYSWTKKYISYRYGSENQYLIKAWNELISSIYTYEGTDRRGVTKSIIELSPSFNNFRTDFMPTIPYYNFSKILDIFETFINNQTIQQYQEIETFQYDSIDFTRQLLSDAFYWVYSQTPLQFQQNNTKKLNESFSLLLQIISDLNALLLSNSNFLYSSWLLNASQLSILYDGLNNRTSQQIYQFNAKNQITLWGPDGNINDYASKAWGGLYKSYYYNSSWNQTLFNIEILEWEQQWNLNFDSLDDQKCEPVGDTFQIIAEIKIKYQQLFQSLAKQNLN